MSHMQPLFLKPFKFALITVVKNIATHCYHCGDTCTEPIVEDQKAFCCQGCKQVYLLLNENNLCNYYNLDDSPGIKAKGKFTDGRFGYLDDPTTIQQLLQFSSDQKNLVTLQLPQMHCASCVFLLENLHRIDPGIIHSQTNFQRKEIFIAYDPSKVSLRKVVELLAFVGYEPQISLRDTSKNQKKRFNRQRIYKIGVAGFCFSNIMMLSFPEYFSSGNIEQQGLKETFSLLNLGLSLPVLLYSASDFFVSAYKGLRQKDLNIDAPIALAILVTYLRSYIEIISGHGAGWLDSGTGIVFFMLVGRWFQDKTYDAFSFDRDYKAYFPLGATLLENGTEQNIPVTKLQKGSRVLVRNEEMVPADSILIRGTGNIDYSFVSGENVPIPKNSGDLIYAGGKQVGGSIEVEIVTPVSQSYITQLWNNEVFTGSKNTERSYIHPWSQYFTIALFSIAGGAAIYWWMVNPANILHAVSSVLIVACPCSLLLTVTFTYGNMMRIFGNHKLYLKNASVIEALTKIDSIILDKTGTITVQSQAHIQYDGSPLTENELAAIKALVRQSAHPLSKVLAASIDLQAVPAAEVLEYQEIPGKGISALIGNHRFRAGSAEFTGYPSGTSKNIENSSSVHISVDDSWKGCFLLGNQYREGLSELSADLKKDQYKLMVLSGDNDAERNQLEQIFPNTTSLQFRQTPQEKLDAVKSLQNQGHRVLMVGDGLNDAGALMQAQVGIAVSDNSSQFSPASDGILDGNQVHLLGKFIRYARSGKKIIIAVFVVSIIYNIVGLSFAVRGALSPMVAAILMPASSISIVSLVTLLSSLSGRQLKR